MTTRIADFSDSVTSAVTPVTNVPTGPQGVPGQAFQLDETGVTFTETERARIELFGTPPSPSVHGLVTKINPYVILIITDSRTDSQRTAGPAELNRDLSRHVIEWNGITSTSNPNASTWFDYGEFTAIDSSKWISADGEPTNSVGVDSDMYLDTGVTIPADAGKVYGPKANGTWPTSTLNIAAGGLTTVDTDGEGLGGNGSASTPLFLELDSSTLTKSASGLKLNDTLNSKLGLYTTPATDGTDNGKVNVANASGVFVLTTGDKTLVGLGYIPNQFDNTLGYAMGDILFFEGINYRARVVITMPTPPAVLTNPDDDPTQWESLGGGGVQLVDGTGSPDVTIEQRGKLKITGQAEITDQGAMADQADIFIPGADPVGFNLFSKGTMELAKAADYTASGGTFTIAEGAALRGTRSANWSLPSSADTLTSPTIDIPVGYRAKLVQFSMIYKSQGPATLTLRDGSTNLKTIDLPAFTAANGSKKIVTFQQLGATQSTIDFVITAGAGITAFNFDDVVITDDFQAGGQLTNVKRSIFTRIPQAATSPSLASVDTRIFDWNTSVNEVVEGDGPNLVSYSRSAANGSVWTAQQDCRVEGFYMSLLGTTGEATGYSVNSTQLTSNIQDINSENVISIGQIFGSNSPRLVPVNFELKQGDVFRCHAGNNNPNTFSEWRLSLKFEKIETQDVTVYNAQTSAANSFSAKLEGRASNGAVTVLSESNSFISSAVRADGVDGSVYNITFNTGMFPETPVITAQIQADPGENIDTAELFNVSTTGCSVQMFRDNAGGTTNTNLNNNFWLVVDRQGGDVRSQTANFVVPVLDETENTFSARIAQTTGTAILESQNGNFISGVMANNINGGIVVTWTPGFFSESPAVVVCPQAEGNVWAAVSAVSDTSCTINVDLDGGSNPNVGMNIVVTRQGTDYKAPKKIDVPLEIVRTLSSIENTFTASVSLTTSGGTLTTDASTPDNIFGTTNGTVSISKAGTGRWSCPLGSKFTVAPAVAMFQTTAHNQRGLSGETVTSTQFQIANNLKTGGEYEDTTAGATITVTARGADYTAPEEVTIATPLIRPNEPFLFQTKTATITANNTGDIITFNNLTLNAIYRATAYFNLVDVDGAGEDAGFTFFNGTTGVSTRMAVANPGESNARMMTIPQIFVAGDAARTLRANLDTNTYSSSSNMVVILEELPYHVATTKWT